MTDFGGLTALVAKSGIKIALGLIATILVAGYLGPEDYGNLSFYIAISIMSYQLGNLFNKAHLIDYFVKADEREVTFHHIFWMTTSVATIIFFSGLTLAYIFPGTFSLLPLLLSLLPTLICSNDVFLFWSYSTHQFFLAAIAQTFGSIGSFIFRIALILLECSWVYFCLFLFVEFGIRYLVLLTGFKVRPKLRKPKNLNPKTIRILAREGLSIAAAGFFLTLFMEYDSLWLKFYDSSEAVGIFTISRKFITIWPIAIGVLSRWALPQLTMHRSHQKTFYKLYLLVLIAGVAGGATINLLVPPIIELFAGKDYRQTIPLLKVLSYGIPPLFLYVFTQNRLARFRQLKKVLIRPVILVTFKTIFNYLLFAELGSIGVALSSCIALYFVCVFDIIFLFSLRRNHL